MRASSRRRAKLVANPSACWACWARIRRRISGRHPGQLGAATSSHSECDRREGKCSKQRLSRDRVGGGLTRYTPPAWFREECASRTARASAPTCSQADQARFPVSAHMESACATPHALAERESPASCLPRRGLVDDAICRRFDYAVAEGDAQEAGGGDVGTPVDDLKCLHILAHVHGRAKVEARPKKLV